MTCVCGIDPGKKGAVAFFFTEHERHVSVHDMPIVDDEVSGPLLTLLMEQIKPDVAFIEIVNAMPSIPTKPGGTRRSMGATSAFTFGNGYGTVIGVLNGLHVPVTRIRPQAWKKHFHLDSDKEKSRALALATFTGASKHFVLKKHADRAEAALLALYGARVIARQLEEVA